MERLTSAPASAPPVAPSPWTRWARRLPEGVLGVLLALWTAEFIWLPMLRYDRFGTFGFDLGIYDQGTWLLSRAKDPFVTIRGLELFGHHVNVILLLLAPFYWLGAGPIFLLVRAGARAGERRVRGLPARPRPARRSKWAGGRARARRCLLQSDVPVAHLGVLPSRRGRHRSVPVRVLGSVDRRWRLFTVAACRVLCKRISPWRWPCSAYVVLRGDRAGGIVAAPSTAYFFFATRVLIPRENGIGPFYDNFFVGLGNSPTEVVYHSVRHPVGTGAWPTLRTGGTGTGTCSPRGRSSRSSTSACSRWRSRRSSSTSCRRFRTPATTGSITRRSSWRGTRWRPSKPFAGSRSGRSRVAVQSAMVAAVLVAANVASVMLGCGPTRAHYETERGRSNAIRP